MSTSTRERLVTATAELMRTQGYAGTSVKQITVAARAPMGSLYHHFPEGKPQIAAAALRTSGAAYIQLLPLLLDPHDDRVHPGTVGQQAVAQRIHQECSEQEPDVADRHRQRCQKDNELFDYSPIVDRPPLRWPGGARVAFYLGR